jgi:hypothetical protein
MRSQRVRPSLSRLASACIPPRGPYKLNGCESALLVLETNCTVFAWSGSPASGDILLFPHTQYPLPAASCQCETGTRRTRNGPGDLNMSTKSLFARGHGAMWITLTTGYTNKDIITTPILTPTRTAGAAERQKNGSSFRRHSVAIFTAITCTVDRDILIRKFTASGGIR